ncbi:MAG: hypothetical protein LDL50_07455 [Chloroflexi bacterium]|nr:hypothetical protein [Chloroflexota bacterium]MCA2001423.1 hypothetical protein [Chloroflexota bacterium]
MSDFFPLVERIEFENPALDAEIYFRGGSVTGLTEKRFGDGGGAVSFFINGEPGASYLLDKTGGKPISQAEFSALSDFRPRAIKLPDVAGRLLSLALESQAEEKFSMAGDDMWGELTARWKKENRSGLVEARLDQIHGFVLFWQGERQKSDMIFSTPQGFIGDFPSSVNANTPWDIVVYACRPQTQAYQYTVLRQGAIRWSRSLLARYQEMVGQKLLQLLNRELARQAQPWRWNIAFDGVEMLDLHFFPYLTDAAHAYRALFMTMGSQMSFVIGSALTHRALSETFEQISPEERAALQAQRLIPAAFSE